MPIYLQSLINPIFQKVKIGISKISAYGILKSATMNRKLSGRYAATWYGAARALR